MKRSFKIVRIILLAVVILLAAGLIAVHLLADQAVKMAIETAGTKALDVEVSLEDVDLSLLRGKIGLKNLSIYNPPNYQHDKLLELTDTQIKCEIKSLLTNVVKIRQVKLDGLTVVLEQRGVTGNNLQDVISKIKTKDEPTSKPSGKKLHIDELVISNITVKAKPLPIPGKADTIILKLKPIKMTNLGSDNKLNTAALTGKVLVAIAGGVAEQGAGVLPKDLIQPLTSELKRLGKLPDALLKSGGQILKDGQDLGSELTEGLTGLLQPKKKENKDPAAEK